MNKKTIKDTICNQLINQDQPFNISLRQDLVCPVSVHNTKSGLFKVIAHRNKREQSWIENIAISCLNSITRTGNSEFCKIGLSFGIDPNAANSTGMRPLHCAASWGYEDVCALLLEKGADMEATDIREQTPLHLAADRGHDGVVTLLIKKGADPNAKIIGGSFKEMTPLHLAIRKGYKAIITTLMEAGADPNETDDMGMTPWHMAATNGHIETVKGLVKTRNRQECLDTMLRAKNNMGMTPLHLAAAHGQTESVKGLLAAGANVSATDDKEETPLHLATRGGHSELVTELLHAKADVQAKNQAAQTPLDLATQTKNKGCNVTRVFAKLWKESNDKETFMNKKDETGGTPLHWSALTGNLEVVRGLVAAKADPNARDNTGNTPLMLADQKGHTDTAKVLSAAEARID